MNGLEVFACGIMWREGEPGFRPPSRSFRNMNPLNLRSPSYATHDADGFDVYPDFISGFNAGLRDLQAKFTGHNAHNLGPSSTITDFFNVFSPASDANDPNGYAQFIAGWCTAALGKTITADSMLSEIWTSPTAGENEI